jgi:hypothetical protein
MSDQSLLSPRVFITAIASLLVVQTCTKHNQADSNYNLTDVKVAEASSQALHYLHACYTAGQEADCDQYREYKSTLKDLSISNDQAANALLQIQQLESTMGVTSGMESLIGQ